MYVVTYDLILIAKLLTTLEVMARLRLSRRKRQRERGSGEDILLYPRLEQGFCLRSTRFTQRQQQFPISQNNTFTSFFTTLLTAVGMPLERLPLLTVREARSHKAWHVGLIHFVNIASSP